LTPAGHVEIKNFLSLANAVIAVFVASLGPFVIMGQIPQLLSRLFPFTRGLNHAYWAPNFWALVTAIDRVLLKCQYASLFSVASDSNIPTDIQITGANIPVDAAGVASSSRGLVGDTVFAVLPQVKPFHTFVITLAWQLVSILSSIEAPSHKPARLYSSNCGGTRPTSPS
jgi:alpha-1,3-glucosyltransferase